MALTPMQTALCNKLATDYAGLISPVKSGKDLYKSKMGQLDSFVRGMAFSNPLDLDAALNDFVNQVQGMLPNIDNISDMDDLLNFMNACPYLSGYAPATAVNGTSNGIFDKIGTLISDLTPSFPEFGAGGIADGINALLSGVGIPGGNSFSDILKKSDDLVNCLNGLCGSSYAGDATEIMNDLNSLYSDLNIIDSGPNAGKFDFNSFYTASGLSTSQQNAINTVTNSIGSQKTGAVTAVNNSIESVQKLKKGGYF
jgi:hypothetical protein